MSPASAVVVGLGSIGTRHARVLGELGLSVTTVSRRGGGNHGSIGEALSRGPVDYVVIATETAQHVEALRGLADAGFRGTVLVEKPILARPEPLPTFAFAKLFVAYNLRFHPVMVALAGHLDGRPAITVSAYVGQDIRDWRPGRDHRATASSTVAAGGGVLRDLSHELDYLLWLFGPWRRVAALGGASGTRDLEVDDHLALLMEMARAQVVQVHLDYLDRAGLRRIRINLADETIEADLVGGNLIVNGIAAPYASERDTSYRAMHQAVLNGDGQVCSLAEGIAVVDLIDASERALNSKSWVFA
ncbi:gfo/Idh/MocA family oxidoreductase [Bradyrhizobium sp. 21]|uniref:Gfo/Idh/MocA family protein n=1 Tax=Bradyrhizobium sp. 21 TaxID=2782666 RepID=UPI001FFABB3B|nr:gfo/Idh/MocA family oxidoreductase [Bradyrhizobium sp. 21]MCK1387481.1 Gfo/Idh/MocA family oxidoreductase [Bradyrhizobium sp. 21]